jgi:hypothetical protein
MDTKSNMIDAFNHKGADSMATRNQYASGVLDWCTQDQKSIDELINEVEELAINRAKKGVESLTYEQKEKMTALIIAALDDPTEFFIELDNLDVIVRFFAKYMLTKEQKYLEMAWSLISRDFVANFDEPLDNLINLYIQAYDMVPKILNLRVGGCR